MEYFEGLVSPLEIQQEIARRVKMIRKKKKWTQKELALRSGISLGSLKRFEQTGEISFASLIKISFALDRYMDILELFKRKEYTTIQEVIDEYEARH